MTEDEKNVREQWEDNIWATDVCVNIGALHFCVMFGQTIADCWSAAAEFTRTRLQQIQGRQLDCEVLQHFAEDQDGSYQGKAFERILAREQAALADLKRGMKEGK